MKSIDREGMESGDDHDQMLRAMFESCDTVGLGLLTPPDFDRLCKKLSMQEHTQLLSEVLFSETNKRKLLCYDTFRDTLVLFLTGDPAFAKDTADYEKETIYTADDQHSEEINDFRTEDKSPKRNESEDDWNNNNGCSDDENTESDRLNSTFTTNGRFSDTNEEVITIESDYTGEPDINDKICQDNGTLLDNRKRPKSTGSPGKYRRYGRRSKPDPELLETEKSIKDSERPVVLREVQMDNAKIFGTLNDGLPENSPWKGVEVSFVSGEPTTPIIMKEEQFTGEGSDNEWKRPDSEWMVDSNSDADDRTSTEDDTVHAAQSALDAVWCRVVGDPAMEAMNESHLGLLCSELGMGSHLSTEEEIGQLFAALDQDNDGYVTFEEFSLQMSVFLSCSSDAEHHTATDEQNSATKYDLDNSTSDVFPDNDRRENVFSTSDIIFEEEEELDDVTAMTSRSTPVQVVSTPNYSTWSERADVTLTHTDVPSNLDSPNKSITNSEESRTPDSRRGLSLDSDTSPLCPPVVAVEPRQLAAMSRSRRRRRSSAVAASNPSGMRQQRRKSSRSVPLPHYHPASLRKLDELPLSYLTEENERYVSLDSLRQCWEQEGLENSSEVFEALQVSTTDQTVSIEALSEVFDMELDQHIVQKAALILYKNGIKHYRSLYEHERAERSKSENNVQHLTMQLNEQEERLENAESRFENETGDIENKYKLEIRNLAEELAAAQEKIKEGESVTKRTEEYEELSDNYEKSQATVAEFKAENDRLSLEKDEAETRLLEAEDAMEKMRADLDDACRGLAMFSREHAAQKKQLADVLRMYETHAQSVQDHNDELLDRLQYSRKRWTPNMSKSPNSRTRSSASSYKVTSPLSRNSDTSSYSSASSMTSDENSSHHLSTVFAANDSSNFMTSSPSESLQRRFIEPEPTNLMVSNAFAFLTPSTTQAKSRVTNNTFRLMPPPPMSSDC